MQNKTTLQGLWLNLSRGEVHKIVEKERCESYVQSSKKRNSNIKHDFKKIIFYFLCLFHAIINSFKYIFFSNVQIISSVCQRPVTHLSLQLLCSKSAQQRLTVWVEDRISAHFSRFTGRWCTKSLIDPVEQRKDKEGQTKPQFNKEPEQHQPQQHFQQSEV